MLLAIVSAGVSACVAVRIPDLTPVEDADVGGLAAIFVVATAAQTRAAPRFGAWQRAADLARELAEAGLRVQVVAERSDVPPDAPIAEYIEGGPGFCEPLPLVVTVGIVPSACPLYFGSRLRLFKQPSDATSVEIDARHGTTSILGWGALLLDLAPSWSFSLPDELGEAYARRVLRARIARALGSAVAN